MSDNLGQKRASGSLEPESAGGGAPAQAIMLGPASTGKCLRPERGAGGKRGEAAPPSESERGWGPASTGKC